ncbi:MAG TPA: hypothetical protein P5140_05600 [Methanofastidiosum sp.]|nr:hypothetical protein [Methanofastidiosum sp.]
MNKVQFAYDLYGYMNWKAVSAKEIYTFLKFLKEDFVIRKDVKTELVELPALKGINKYCLSVRTDEFAPWILVHVDRIPVSEVYFSISEEHVSGQLDNVLGIAIVKQLIAAGVRVNILFTTSEEHCLSYKQIDMYFRCFYPNKNPVLIDLDIDVFHDLTEFAGGEITIRDRDERAMFNRMLVEKLRSIATENSIPWLNLNTWTLVQMGLLCFYTNYTGAYVGIPVVNYHTGYEETYLTCVNNVFKLLYLFLNNNEYKGEQKNKEDTEEIYGESLVLAI